MSQPSSAIPHPENKCLVYIRRRVVRPVLLVLVLVQSYGRPPTMVVLTQKSEVYPLSDKSTPAIPDSFFHATEFVLGAGVVTIQQSTGKVVVVENGEGRWFLPKGRKDEGESLEKTALREGYEEVRLSTPTPSLRG